MKGANRMNISADEQKETVRGVVDSVIYSSDETGYAVCEVEDENGLPIVLVGTMPYISEGDSLTAVGRWTHHATYGRQFKVDMYEKTLPSSTGEILRYLSSGAVKGIGPKTAEKIVSKFGEDSFDVIENHPDWLAELPGITKRKADDISSAFIEMSGARNVMMFCSDYFGSATSMKIYRKWGGKAVDMIRANPYRLCEDFSGIGFRRADAIAGACGLSHDSDARIASGIIYTLKLAAQSGGHTCLPMEKLILNASSILSVEEAKIPEIIELLCASAKLVKCTRNNTEYVYLSNYRSAEVYCADKLRQINRTCPKIDPGDISSFISRVEAESGIHYAALQREAVSAALSGGIMILTGGPGTGKTTVIKGLLSIFNSMGLNVALAAPTGRAAKRMSEACGCEAKTVHRLLEMEHNGDEEPKFFRNQSCYLEEDAVIIDETSMVDIILLEALLKAAKPGCRIIFIGDRDQLPSVGAGNVLCDMIESRAFVTVCLTEIFRQAKESRIIVNAHLINEGKLPIIDNKSKDFFFLRRSDSTVASTVADLCKSRLPKAYGDSISGEIQVITPSRKGSAGTEELNILLQSCLNPPGAKKKERAAHGILLRDGDRIMQNKNNYDVEWEKDGYEGLGVFNGDVGTVVSIDPPSESVELNFDGRVCTYDLTQLDEIEHAYAITVHKSQGSEYPVVIIPLYSCAPMLQTRNLLYTAVTRASRMVILVGNPDVLSTMVENNSGIVRYTGLCQLLQNNE